MGSPGTGSLNRRRIDRYELHELIGEGGMGAVYRAVDSRLGRTVAVKTVVSNRWGPAETSELRQRFMREALAASKVEHRNVVQVIDFGVADDGTPYLVMEYLRGRDLGAVLKKSRTALEISYVADVMLGVCAALRACHQAGIVHRDLKPSNIFLANTDTGPEIKVLDFGVSKAPMAGDLTQEGQILGTPQYLSPEQINGKVGPSSDQYALGVLLYVCLTKKLPFEEHQNLSLLRAIDVGRFSGPRLHRPEIPEALETIVLRAMSRDPAARFASVHALGQALWAFASARGQVEWKSFYFGSPSAKQTAEATLGGLSLAPTPLASDASANDGIPLPRPVEPTAVLPPENATPVLEPALGSPQLNISTKLAKPTPPPEESESTASGEKSRWRVWAALGVATGLLSAGVAVGFRHRDAPPPTAVLATPVSPPTAGSAPDPTSNRSAAGRLAAAPTPPPSPEPRPAAAVGGPAADGASPAAAPPQRRRPAERKAHTHRSDDAPKASALDKNGIGIPSN
jgi:serine/threonine-protein kinase